MKAHRIEYRKPYNKRREGHSVEYFDFEGFLQDLTSFISRNHLEPTYREVADATDLSVTTVKAALDGYSLGLKAACRLAAYADLSLDKYVGEL